MHRHEEELTVCLPAPRLDEIFLLHVFNEKIHFWPPVFAEESLQPEGSKSRRQTKHQYLQLFRVTRLLVDFPDIGWFGFGILNGNILVLKCLSK